MYATGELIIGNFVNNEYPTTGTVLSTCLYSGKIAADNASKGITSKYSTSSAKKMTAATQKAKKSNTVYKDGVYTAEAKGMNGPVKVEVSVEGKKIAAVKVVSHSETPGISDPAFDVIPAAMVKANSFEVDGVSGATMTSKALIESVKLALKDAR